MNFRRLRDLVIRRRERRLQRTLDSIDLSLKRIAGAMELALGSSTGSTSHRSFYASKPSEVSEAGVYDADEEYFALVEEAERQGVPPEALTDQLHSLDEDFDPLEGTTETTRR